MTTWVLIILFSTGNGLATTNIPNFKTKADCQLAGSIANTNAGTFLGVRWFCVEQ